MHKLLTFLAALVLSTNVLCDVYVTTGLGVAGTSLDGHGDTAYSLGAGYTLTEVMGNRVDAIAQWAHTPDEDFASIGIQVERSITGPLSAYVKAGGQYQDLNGEGHQERCTMYRGNFFTYGECDDFTTSESDTDISYFVGVGVAAEVDEQLDLILQAVWQDVDTDFDKSSNDSMITAGLRFWF